MRAKDFTITAGIAIATMIGALALVGPTGVDARRGAKRTIRTKGVQVSIRTTRTTRHPTARLTLVNTTDDTVQVNPRIALYTEGRGSEFSRMASPPRQRWTDEPLYVLEPGETKTVDVDPATKLPRRSLAWFSLRAGKRQMDTVAFVTRSPRKAGKLANKGGKKPGKRPAKVSRRSANRVAKAPMMKQAAEPQMAMAF